MKSPNSITPIKKGWDKKVNINYNLSIIPPLKREGNTITLSDEIADHYANTSRDPHKKSKPWKHRKRKKN